MTTRKPMLLGLLAALSLNLACRQDMQDQPKYKPLAESRFYPDGRSARPIPEHTIARDELNDTDSYHTGASANGAFLDTIPVRVDMSVLKRGQERFDIFCSPCHSRLGDGNGMVAQRGVRIPANLHTDRLRSVPPGYLFQVISNGYGAMGDYGDQIPVDDRWAIVAYVHALQLSRHATPAEVPTRYQNQLNAPPTGQSGAAR